MTVWDMPGEEVVAIDWYVHGHTDRDGWLQVSSFRAVLRDARGATGRDLNTGAVLPERDEHSASWLGALGYLVLLDQLGRALRPRDAIEQAGEPSFRTALRVFAPEIPEDDRFALYALRCSFAHHYTLYNPHNDLRLQHYFNLDPKPTAPLVTVPPVDRRWNGQVVEERSGDATFVGLRSLGDLVESIVHRLEVASRSHELQIAPGVDGPRELLLRYSFQFVEDGGPHPPRPV